ncbi:MAG TPA: ferritin, partial [Alphaproteobacteria bacterium]|nr:ferritin [Alphaproteobacteria bacterium]
AINALVDTALTTKDFSTFNFLQWYVAEQHEEEKIFRSILDKLAMFDDKSPFFVDKELARMAVSQ